MLITLVIAVGSVLLVVSGFAWAARRDEVAQVDRLGRLQVGPLSEVEDGALWAARGRVIDGAEVSADPVTGARVARYEARVLRRDRGEVLASASVGDRVRLDDGSGRVAAVQLEGAELGLAMSEVERSDRMPGPKMLALLESVQRDAPDADGAARYVLEHRAIEVGDSLTLIGMASVDGDRVSFTSRGPLYLIAEPLSEFQARQREDLRAMDVMLKLGAGLGLVLIATGIVLVLFLS